MFKGLRALSNRSFFFFFTFQNPLLDGRELSSFIAPVPIRPGSEAGKSLSKWQKSTVSESMWDQIINILFKLQYIT